MQTTAWLILLFPLLGCIVIGLGFRVLPARLVGAIGTLAIAAAFVAAVLTTLSLQDRGEEQRQVVYTAWDYAVTAGVDAKLSILVDPLSMFMALVVSGVSTLIHLYSVAYLGGDRGYARFFAYLNFFVFSMLVLVLAGNFFILIVGWAFVGAASYLLISFWYRRTTATAAGIKAFVINVVGDVGLVLGTYFIFRSTGTLDFLGTFARAPQVFPKGDGDLTAGLLLVLVGAFAKSAQVPLHTWLPDAMEGPTPVSALIHAATMVTAGVYVAGLFHLMSHAFFKALLFMAAGSLIGAMAGEQSLDRMGGFRRVLPFTFACFVIGGLALSGIPPFSGFFSKDEILLVLGEQGGWKWILYVAGYVGAFMTAIYTWRMIFRAFWGDPVPEAREMRDTGHLYHAPEPFNPATGETEDTDVGFPGPEHHIAERALPMKAAMALLAVGAVVLGVLQLPFHATDVIHN